MRNPSRDQGNPDRFRVDVKAQLALPNGDSVPCTIRGCSPTGLSVDLHAAYRETDDLQGEFAFIEFTVPAAGDLSLAVMIDQAAEWRMELAYLSPQPEITDAMRAQAGADNQRRSEDQREASPRSGNSLRRSCSQIRREFVTVALKAVRKALRRFAETVEDNLFEAADRAVSNQVADRADGVLPPTQRRLQQHRAPPDRPASKTDGAPGVREGRAFPAGRGGARHRIHDPHRPR